MRLQQTVEGLSVAAISYYVVGLFGYLAKAGESEGMSLKSSVMTGLFVPVAVLSVWLITRRIRKRHEDEQH